MNYLLYYHWSHGMIRWYELRYGLVDEMNHNLSPLTRLATLTSLNLTNVELEPASLSALSSLRSLSELILSRCSRLKSKFFALLVSLPALTHLDLSYCAIDEYACFLTLLKYSLL